MDRITNLITVARFDDGTEEVPRGSNCGPRVEQALKTCGLGKGYAWCMAIVVQWILEASSGKCGIRRTADCDAALNQARLLNAIRSKPQIGDVFLRLNPQNRADANHAGIVTRAFETSFLGIAGNTNDSGSREGYQVCEKLVPNIKNYVFYNPFVFNDRARADGIPQLIVNGKPYDPAYNYKEGRMYVSFADFTRELLPSVDPVTLLPVVRELPSQRRVNGKSMVQLRELLSLPEFSKFSTNWNSETLTATILPKTENPA